MFALPIAMLLALPVSDIQPAAGPATAAEPSIVPTTLIPSGTATGSWVGATIQEEGVLVALMVDEIGRPLFVMDAHLTPQGMIYGELRPLEYATNPALGLPSLFVAGEALLHPTEAGSFWAVISGPLDGGLLPVKPFGRIEGVLLHGMERAVKPGYGVAQPELASGQISAQQAGGDQGIVAAQAQRRAALGSAQQPSGHFGTKPQSASQSSIALVSGAQQPSGHFGTKPQSASQHVSYSLSSLEPAFVAFGAKPATAQSQQTVSAGVVPAEEQLHCIVCPKGPALAIQSVTQPGQAVAPVGGQPAATVIVCPWEGPSVSATTPAGQAAASGELPAGSSVQVGKVDLGVQPLEPTQPVAGEGRVRATWYLLP